MVQAGLWLYSVRLPSSLSASVVSIFTCHLHSSHTLEKCGVVLWRRSFLLAPIFETQTTAASCQDPHATSRELTSPLLTRWRSRQFPLLFPHLPRHAVQPIHRTLDIPSALTCSLAIGPSLGRDP